MRPTRNLGRTTLGRLLTWSCTGCGLPCPRHYWRGGELLPRHFTLTPCRAVCFLLHFQSPRGARTLSGILSCGVRTFLAARRSGPARPPDPLRRYKIQKRPSEVNRFTDIRKIFLFEKLQRHRLTRRRGERRERITAKGNHEGAEARRGKAFNRRELQFAPVRLEDPRHGRRGRAGADTDVFHRPLQGENPAGRKLSHHGV